LKRGGTYRASNENAVNVTPCPPELQFKLSEIEVLWHEIKVGAEALATNLSESAKRKTYQDSANGGPLQVNQTDDIQLQIRSNLNFINQGIPRVASLAQDVTFDLDQFRAAKQTRLFGWLLALSILNLAVVSAGYWFFDRQIFSALPSISKAVQQLASGNPAAALADRKQKDELGNIMAGINQVADYLTDTSAFAKEVGKGNFDQDLKVRGQQDVLGQALRSMREDLKKADEVDKISQWTSTGIAKFADILRANVQNQEEMAYQIIANLVKYIGANQGSLFVVHEKNGRQVLALTSAYAYDKRKYLQKEVPMGNGLLGQAAWEGSTAFYTNLPNGYTEITSGLGETTPGCLLIVPLKTDQKVYGVLEIAGFERFADHQIAFVESLSDRIAVTLAAVKSNATMRGLLEESQLASEQLRAQEEEMRQNVEELLATQEEMHRVQSELREKEENLNLILNQTDTSVFSLDEQFNLVVINEALKRQFKRDSGKDVRVGQNVFDFVPAHIHERRRREYLRALNGESFTTVENYKGLDHSDNYYETNFSPLINVDKQVNGISVFMRNITHLRPIRWE
jgi:PAS domain S-box-containing protein